MSVSEWDKYLIIIEGDAGETISCTESSARNADSTALSMVEEDIEDYDVSANGSAEVEVAIYKLVKIVKSTVTKKTSTKTVNVK